MPITIEASVSKKVPIPGAEFSSRSASLTIRAEVTVLTDIAGQAARLYQEAEAAIDAQLGITAAAPASKPPHHAPQQPATSGPSQSSTPYRGSSQRRAPAPITESQVNFIGRLLTETRTTLDPVLAHFQVGSLRDLSARQGSELIDSLKSKVPA